MIMTFYRLKATILYIVFIISTNSLFVYVPCITLFRESLSPADAMVGCIYILRDFAQREIKSYVIIAMLIGGGLSYLFASNTVAFASLCAFFTGELVDWALFTWTRKPLSQRLLISSVCSSPLDSFVFLVLIGRLNWVEFSVITLFKFVGIFGVWAYWRANKNIFYTFWKPIKTIPS
jgi:queuosine precursor transporter